ncbi:hypothetical protein N8818_03380 [Candidatus Pelagibacter sp.]|nr:hypothetical protein [Candidatus Pelagibacter sp.]
MSKDFQLIIPVAGPNYDFEKFNNHKLLIDINDKKLVKWVQVSRPYNLSDGIFIFQKRHNNKYDLVNKISKILGKKIRYFILNNYTAGAPQSVLRIKNEIDLKKPLFIDLLDQYIDFKNFFKFCLKNNYDGCVPIFQSLYFNRGYAKIDKQKYITKISEKDPKPISTNSTACVSYFREAKFFFENAELMIKKKILSSNGKYMISLVYNEMIKNNYKIKSYDCEYIASLGSYNSVKSFYENCRLIKY